MKRCFGLLAAALLVLSAESSAQCSTFAIDSQLDPSGTFQTVTVDVSGSAPLALTLMVAGETAGATSISVLGDTLDLGLAAPFFVAPLGTTDASGDLSTSFDLPPDLGLTLFAQSVGVEISFSPGGFTATFCESNVDSVTL